MSVLGTGGEVVVAIKAVDEASSVMDKVRASLSIFSDQIGQLGGGFESVGSVIKGFAGGGVMGAASAAIGEVVKGLQWCVGEATEAEQAMKNLSIAVEKSGTSWKAVEAPTSEALSKLQEMTKFSDEKLAGALQRLVTLGVDYKTAMQALSTVTDLAAAKQIDLDTAATAVGRALTGNATALQRLGVHLEGVKGKTGEVAAELKTIGPNFEAIEASVKKAGHSVDTLNEYLGNIAPHAKTVEEVMAAVKEAFEEGARSMPDLEAGFEDLGISFEMLTTKGASAEKILATLNEKFAGTAAEQAKTYAGTQEKLKNAISDLGEKIGGALIPAMDGLAKVQLTVVQGASSFIDNVQRSWKAFTELPDVQKTVEGLNTAWEQLQKGASSVADELGKAVMPIFEELWGALKEVGAALKPVLEAFGEIWKALTGFGSEGKNAYTIFNLIADVLKISIVPTLRMFVDLIKLITPGIKLIAEGFRDTIAVVAPFISQLIEGIGGLIAKIKEIFGGFYKWLVGGSFIQDTMAAVSTAMQEGIAAIVEGVGTWLGNVTAAFTNWGSTLLDSFGNLWNQMVDVVGNAFKRIYDAVKSGIDAVTNFFSSLWKTLTGGSIWTDMWSDMLSQTVEGFDQILTQTRRSVGDFESMFAGTAGSLSVPGAALPLGPAAASASVPTGLATSARPAHQTLNINITVQHMTGEVKDLENLTRMISRELGSSIKWRR